MFENADKSAAWHTAFYYMGEHLRALSDGAVNHKILFDLVGSDGGYYNHGNPLVRKKTAGTLSRIVHSDRYAESMRRRIDGDPSAFRRASEHVVEAVCMDKAISPDELLSHLSAHCLRDVVKGLENECEKHGRSLNAYRVECEAGALLSWISEQELEAPADRVGLSVCLLESMFRFMAFGRLESEFAESLISETPLFGDTPRIAPSPQHGACLAKYDYATSSLTGHRWLLDPDAPFSIGRYTTCDAIETARMISRRHCLIFCEAGVWYLKDCGTRSGCTVVRGREGTVYDSLATPDEPFPLQFEDRIELAQGSSRYLFAEICA